MGRNNTDWPDFSASGRKNSSRYTSKKKKFASCSLQKFPDEALKDAASPQGSEQRDLILEVVALPPCLDFLQRHQSPPQSPTNRNWLSPEHWVVLARGLLHPSFYLQSIAQHRAACWGQSWYINKIICALTRTGCINDAVKFQLDHRQK